jgi:hypothetical protein
MWWSKIQIGIDLATSVTIFAAALTWWMNKVRRGEWALLTVLDPQ